MALIILRLFNVTTFFYLVLGIVAGIGFAIVAIIVFANVYARRTGRYQNLASRYTTYQYLSQQDIDHYGLQLASTKQGLLFFLVEVVCYMVIVGGAFLLTVFFTPVM